MQNHYFIMRGPALDQALPLRDVVQGLASMQCIIEKSFLVASGRARMSKKDRETFHLQASDFRRGSFIAELQLVTESVEYLWPAVATIHPSRIWDYTQAAFEYIKLILAAKQTPVQPDVHVHDSGNVEVTTGDTHITFNAPVNILGPQVIPHYKDLSKLTNNGIDSISLVRNTVDSDDSAFRIEAADRDLFERLERVEDPPVEINCNIFDFNKHSLHGKMEIPDGQDIPEGRYGFVLESDSAVADAIQSMLYEEIRVRCIQQLLIGPLNEEDVDHIRVLDIL